MLKNNFGVNFLALLLIYISKFNKSKLIIIIKIINNLCIRHIMHDKTYIKKITHLYLRSK